MKICANNSFCTLLGAVESEFQKSAPHFFLSYSSLVHNQSFKENGLFLIYETRKSKTQKSHFWWLITKTWGQISKIDFPFFVGTNEKNRL